MIHRLSLRRETSPTGVPESPATANSTVRRLERLLKNENAPVNIDLVPVNADHQEAPSTLGPAVVLEESSHLVDLNKAVAFDVEGREGDQRVAIPGAPRQKMVAASEQGFAMEIARVRAEALREGRVAAAAEYERQAANERRRWLAAFEEQLADVRRNASESEAAAVRDVQQAAVAAAEQRLELERARVWEEAICLGRAEAEADAERRFAEHDKRLGEEFEAQLAGVRTDAERERAAAVQQAHEAVTAAAEERLTGEIARAREAAILESERQRLQELARLSAKVEQLIADQLRAAQVEDERRRDRVAAATRALAALDVDLAEVAGARRQQVERVQIEVRQALTEAVHHEAIHLDEDQGGLAYAWPG
jgi:hypothetical protein